MVRHFAARQRKGRRGGEERKGEERKRREGGGERKGRGWREGST